MEKRYTKEQRYRNNDLRRKEQELRRRSPPVVNKEPEQSNNLSFIIRLAIMIITAGIISGN